MIILNPDTIIKCAMVRKHRIINHAINIIQSYNITDKSKNYNLYALRIFEAAFLTCLFESFWEMLCNTDLL